MDHAGLIKHCSREFLSRKLRNFLLLGTILLSSVVFAQTGSECNAFAGTLTGFKPSDCLLDGGTAIGGIPNGDAVVPSGFSKVYLLTTSPGAVSYTHLRAHETVLDIVCRLLLEKKKIT